MTPDLEENLPSERFGFANFMLWQRHLVHRRTTVFGTASSQLSCLLEKINKGRITRGALSLFSSSSRQVKGINRLAEGNSDT